MIADLENKEKVKRRNFLDEIDKKLLNILQKDGRRPILEIAKELNVSKSTISYRLNRLEEEGIIEGYYAKLNASKLGDDIQIIVQVRAKFGQGYAESIGNTLAQIPGVWGVYFVYGENDFIIIARSKNREEMFEKMNNLYNSNDIERTTTYIVGKTIKDDQRTFFDLK
ncbi:MAG: Lrp/AsnC family transcriptional regulator [Promethearchaeota archaeon]|nr:MAG: Lrp/AsnC family transcriptional regulator [Candidatus Lokiarchaeota archaeon]